jgi:adenylate cyclase
LTKIGILPKTVLLLATLATVPVVASTLLLLDTNKQAIKTTERQLQASLLAEASGTTTRLLRSAQNDAEAVAIALAEAARATPAPGEGDGMSGVRATLATRSSFDAVRFEVPQANVSTILRVADRGKTDVPSSSDALRQAADERGVGLLVTGPGKATLTVAVPMAAATDKKPAKGYVTANVDLAQLTPLLTELAERRFGKDARMLLVDGDKRAIASAGPDVTAAGELTSAHPLWKTIPAGIPWSQRVDTVVEYQAGSEEMVGAFETIPDIGWALAVWRPERVAYAPLHTMERRGALVASVAALIALLAGLLSSLRLTRPILALRDQASLIGERAWAKVQVPALGGDELGQLATSLRTMAHSLQTSEERIEEEARLRGDLSRYLSRDLVQQIVSGEHSLELGGQRRAITVLFADVVAFTPLAESHPPEVVVALLNELFSLLSEIVFRHGGTIDKFIGDCVMAVWGAPIASDDHAHRALQAAEDMLRFLENANPSWQEKYGMTIRLGIGVNTGAAIVGNVGSDKRMEYTVIGDTVNVAARLEGIAGPDQVLVGEATYARVGDDFEFEAIGERTLTGRSAPSQIYSLRT